MLSDIKNIIFDLDGTLWDSREICSKAWSYVLFEENIDKSFTVDEFTGVMGLKHDELAEKLLPEFDSVKQVKIMEKCYSQEIKHIVKHGGNLFNDVEDLLKTLINDGKKLFIVSNCQAGYIEAFLQYYSFNQYFIDFNCSGSTGLSKADNIKLLMRKNNLSNCVYIGDTQGDKDAAMTAGIPFVWSEYGFGRGIEADYKISKISNIKDIV